MTSARERYALVRAKRCVSARTAVNHQLPWPFAVGVGALPLPKLVRSAILASKRPGIWRMSAQQQTTVQEAVFDLFRAFGTTTIFGNPGSTELPMFRDFPGDFRYVLALHEMVAVSMADGYAQATRNAGLVNLHSATGLGHSLGAVFTAYKNQAPLVIIAGQQARSILPYEPFLFSERAAEFPRPYVKWSCEPARPEDVPAAIARAYYTAMQPPRGPTFVSVPVDDWDRPCDPVEPRRLGLIGRGDPVLLAQMAEALSACARPAFVVGAAVARDDVWNEVIALA